MKLPVVISLRKALPICATPKGGLRRRRRDDVVEVDEDALGRLGAQMHPAVVRLDGPHVGLEHQVEVARVGEGAPFAASGAGVALELVGAIAAAAARAVDQGVGEVSDVAAGDPDRRVHQYGGVQADHVAAAPDEGLPPRSLDVVLQLDAERTVVPRAGETAVDLAALEQKAPALAQRRDGLKVDRFGVF